MSSLIRRVFSNLDKGGYNMRILGSKFHEGENLSFSHEFNAPSSGKSWLMELNTPYMKSISGGYSINQYTVYLTPENPSISIPTYNTSNGYSGNLDVIVQDYSVTLNGEFDSNSIISYIIYEVEY